MIVIRAFFASIPIFQSREKWRFKTRYLIKKINHSSIGYFQNNVLTLELNRLNQIQSEMNKSDLKRLRKTTIEIIPGEDSELIDRETCRKLLGIGTSLTITKYYKALGLARIRFITWEQFKEVLKLQLFLSCRHGYNSKEMFLALRETNSLSIVFETYRINPDKRFEEIKNDYYNQRKA